MTHDYESALREFRYMDSHDMRFNHLDDISKQTIIRALKLAHKVTQEPSEGMTNSAKELHPIGAWIAGKIFKSMIAQALREIS